MIQKIIRTFLGVPYTNEEADELTQELNDRTKHTVNGYNSMSELGIKVLANENTGTQNGDSSSTNAGGIATNVTNIATNVTNIATNVTNINLREVATNKGSNNGYAELDANGKVPAAQIPAGSDSVEEYANLAAFPATGTTNVIYIAIDTTLTYRWGGTVYAALDPSLALGETSATAYRGDRGKTAFDHSQDAHAPANATDDQTDAEIRTAVEAATDSNVFTDNDHSKLNNIQSNATVDQTGAQIKVAYELENDTNAFDDAAVTKLGNIETSATADQSDAEIKTAYENNANTNALTDSNLSNIVTNTSKVGVTTEEANTINTELEAGMNGEDLVLNILSLTQAEYNAGTPISTTFYVITDA